MSTVFRSRQRAEDFAARVDGTTTRLREVPAESSTAAGRETERLVGLVTTLRRHAELDELATPGAAFSVDLRERLMAEAMVALTPRTAVLSLPPRTRGRRERRLVAAATAAVLIGGTAGMAAAAQHALPGEALYPVKRGIEKIQIELSGSPAGRGNDLLGQATERLEEAHRLMAGNPATASTQIVGTVDQFTSQARSGANLMMGSYRSTGDPKTIGAVRGFAARDLGSLEALSKSAPPQAQPGLQKAALALRDIDSRASRLCEGCSGLPTLKVPEIFLASAEVDRALTAVRDRKLDNSHPVIVDKHSLPAVTSPAGSSPDRTSAGSRTAAAPPSNPATSNPGTGNRLLKVPGGQTDPTTKSPVKPKLKLPSVSAPTPSGDPDTGNLGTGLGAAIKTLLPKVSTPPLP